MSENPAQKTPVERFLVKPLEAFYAQHYPQAQTAEVVKRFSTLSDDKLVGLYDFIIANCDRKPVLSKMIEMYERSQRAANPESQLLAPLTSGRMPWDVRADKARKEAAAYALDEINLNGQWAQSVHEGWGSVARGFIYAWAVVQSEAVQGHMGGFGVDREMLGNPNGDDEYEARLNEMKRAKAHACTTGTIHVPCPDWLVHYGRTKASATVGLPPRDHRQAGGVNA